MLTGVLVCNHKNVCWVDFLVYHIHSILSAWVVYLDCSPSYLYDLFFFSTSWSIPCWIKSVKQYPQWFLAIFQHTIHVSTPAYTSPELLFQFQGGSWWLCGNSNKSLQIEVPPNYSFLHATRCFGVVHPGSQNCGMQKPTGAIVSYNLSRRTSLFNK